MKAIATIKVTYTNYSEGETVYNLEDVKVLKDYRDDIESIEILNCEESQREALELIINGEQEEKAIEPVKILKKVQRVLDLLEKSAQIEKDLQYWNEDGYLLSDLQFMSNKSKSERKSISLLRKQDANNQMLQRAVNKLTRDQFDNHVAAIVCDDFENWVEC